MRRQVLFFISIFYIGYVVGQVSYSIPEEMPKGSVVGNIARDLGIDVRRLKSGKSRIFTSDSAEYIELSRERGVLLLKERIDRESLCRQTTPCALHLQIILENPMELFRITVEITDINDNSPSFKNDEKRFEISESAVTGSKFVLERAVDADIGINGLKNYSLRPTDNFVLKIENQADGQKKVEMVLQKPLDREKEEQISLLLNAVDGGDPQMSGTVKIYVTVLDVNDNAPVFTKSVYKATIAENSQKGTTVTTVSASDADKGTNGDVSYLVSATMDSVSDIFTVNQNGEVILVGEVDFEKAKYYQIDIEAKDSGGLSDSSKVIVDVIDINDNEPVISILSKSDSIPENSPHNTVIVMFSVYDSDSSNNGQVNCRLNSNIPFTITAASNDFYSLVTDKRADNGPQFYRNDAADTE
ncbi:protocadherin beta-1-like [Pundamilia nyererei]|uniref:Protocadherin beta-1-like n=1 Tax=Pundamilia nyererei TaxID=303518 RepID=A0A9Y3QXX2_9CICH|nr:PREDICTED: protocadherin beta-1-like [Pundamilia nyererei]